jgi:hypothetical protein
MHGARGLAWGHAAHHVGAVLDGLLGVECALECGSCFGAYERSDVMPNVLGNQQQRQQHTCLPVNPWQMTRVSLLMSMFMAVLA